MPFGAEVEQKAVEPWSRGPRLYGRYYGRQALLHADGLDRVIQHAACHARQISEAARAPLGRGCGSRRADGCGSGCPGHGLRVGSDWTNQYGWDGSRQVEGTLLTAVQAARASSEVACESRRMVSCCDRGACAILAMAVCQRDSQHPDRLRRQERARSRCRRR
jgi:hypothetical protein